MSSREPDDTGPSRGGQGLDVAVGAVGRRLSAVLGQEDTQDTPGADLRDAWRPQAGQRVGDYAVLRELGSGGMGTVLLAERADGTFTRQVALKLIRGFPTEEGRKRLRRERQILAELDHPAIARLLDGGETEDGQPYLVMEYVAGQGLLEHVAARGLELRARVVLWRSLAEAVAHAHQRLVVHRDLKPSNVLVRDDGVPKLLDFGIAKLVDLGDDTDRASTRVYSPGYASPEQVAGQPITTRTDVYALGTLLRELLLGIRGDGQPSEPPVTAVQVDADLRAIVECARTPEPSGRYPTVDAMLDDVRRWERGLPVGARGQNRAYRARKFVWLWRGPVALALTAVVTAILIVVELRDSRDRARVAEKEARAAQSSAEDAARRANKLLRFVTSTFEAASPDHALGKELSLNDLLAAARARVDAAAPEDSRDLSLFLADLYKELGEPVAAAELVRSATTALGEPRTTAEGRWLAQALARQARHLASDDRGAEAVVVGLRADELRARYAPEDPDMQRSVRLGLGLAYHHVGEPAAAARLLEPIVTATAGAPFEDVLAATYCLAAVEEDRGDGMAVLRLSERLRQLLSGFPPEHPRQRLWLANAARGERMLGRYGQAIEHYRQAIDLLSPAVGGRGSALAGLYNDLGVVALQAGRFRLGSEALERSARLVTDDASPASHAVALVNLASALERSGEYARAEALLDQAIALEGSAATPERRRLVRANRARTVALRGRFDEARRELEAVRRELSPEDPSAEVLDTLRLAQVELWAGRTAVARAHLDALSRHIAADESGDAFRRAVARARAQAALLDGDSLGALAAFDRLEVEYGQALGNDSYDTDLVRADRARALAAAGRVDEAREVLREVLPRLREATGPNERNLVLATQLAHSLGL